MATMILGEPGPGKARFFHQVLRYRGALVVREVLPRLGEDHFRIILLGMHRGEIGTESVEVVGGGF